MKPRPLLPLCALAGALLCSPAWSADPAAQPGLRLRSGNAGFASGTSLVDIGVRLPRIGWLGPLGTWLAADTDPVAARRTGARHLVGLESIAPTDGLRVSGGLVGVARHTVFGPRAPRDTGLIDMSLQALHASSNGGLTVSVPYVGVGYSGAVSTEPALRSAEGGWRFSADLGVMALSTSNSVRLDRVIGGQQSLDDVLREARLTPLLQLGVTYRF